MIKETVLRDFPNWTSEKQLSEYQAYKKLGDYSPFSDADYQLMEMVMNNPNAEISVQCEDGVCEIITASDNDLVDLLIEAVTEEQTKLFELIKRELLANTQVHKFIKDGDQENKRRVMSYMLKNFNADVIASLANIFAGLGGDIDNKTIFDKWEKVVLLKYKNLITKLKDIGIVDVIDPTDFKINYHTFDVTILSTVKKYPQVAAIIFLDLVNLLAIDKRTSFLKSLVSILDTIQHPVDAPVADITQDEEVNTSSDNKDLEFEETNEILTLALTRLKIDAIEASPANIKDIGGNEDVHTKNMSVTSLAEYHDTRSAKDDAHKINEFDRNKLKERFMKEFKDGVEQNLNDDINLINKFIDSLSTTETITDAVEMKNKKNKLTNEMVKALLRQFSIDYASSDNKDTLQTKLISGLKNFESIDAIKSILIDSRDSKLIDKQNIENNINADPDFIILNKLKKIANLVDNTISYDDIRYYYTEINKLGVNIESPAPGQIKTVLNAVYRHMMRKEMGEKYSELAKKLMNYGKDAEGRGEKFVEFALPFSYSGGQNSYDIKLGPMAFEIKTYQVVGNTIESSIRLGQEGNLFKAEKFARLFIFISDLSSIFNNDGNNYELLKSLFSSSMTKENYSTISKMLNTPLTSRGYSLVDQLRKGEFSATNMVIFKKLIVVLKESLISVKKNNFYFMKIYLRHKNLDLSIEPIDDTETKLEHIEATTEGDTVISFKAKTLFSKEEQQAMTSTILRILGNTEILNNEDYLEQVITEAMEQINAAFVRHPMIILHNFSKDVNPSEVCSGVHTQFIFSEISQNKFKIIPIGYRVGTVVNNK